MLNANGLRMLPELPPPPPKLSGNSLIVFVVMMVLCSADSVLSCGFDGDRHRLRSGADLQPHVDPVGDRDLNLNILLDEFLKSLHFDCQRVTAGRQGRKGIVAGAGRERFRLLPGTRVGSDNSCLRNHRSGLIFNFSCDSPAIVLRHYGERER
jgi:hypothetical protein